ncbi:MAG TPA: hypothetical protein VFE97_02270 [Methylomirabilota bacterium]|nr:hypothetical protein [Methylomirabilota bacterium]
MAVQPGGMAYALTLYLIGAPLLFAAVAAAFIISWTHPIAAPANLETAIEAAVSKPIKAAVAAAIKKAVEAVPQEVETATKKPAAPRA